MDSHLNEEAQKIVLNTKGITKDLSEEGREEGIKQLILKQYSKGLSIEYIADINEIDVEYVRDVVKNNTPEIK